MTMLGSVTLLVLVENNWGINFDIDCNSSALKLRRCIVNVYIFSDNYLLCVTVWINAASSSEERALSESINKWLSIQTK